MGDSFGREYGCRGGEQSTAHSQAARRPAIIVDFKRRRAGTKRRVETEAGTDEIVPRNVLEDTIMKYHIVINSGIKENKYCELHHVQYREECKRAG